MYMHVFRRQSSERDTHEKRVFMYRTPQKYVCISKADKTEQRRVVPKCKFEREKMDVDVARSCLLFGGDRRLLLLLLLRC